MQAIILAAGRGSRLAPLTDDRPKAMVMVAGRPIFWRVVDSLLQAGVSDIIAVTNGYSLAAHIYAPSGARVQAAVQETPLGTADALAQVGGMASPFLLLGCDSLFPADHIRAVMACPAQIVLSGKRERWPGRHQSTISYQGRKIAGIAEKPAYPTSSMTSLMLYKLPPFIFDYLAGVEKSARGELEIQSAINAMIADGTTVSVVACDDYFHLTNASDLRGYNDHQRQKAVKNA